MEVSELLEQAILVISISINGGVDAHEVLYRATFETRQQSLSCRGLNCDMLTLDMSTT